LKRKANETTLHIWELGLASNKDNFWELEPETKETKVQKAQKL